MFKALKVLIILLLLFPMAGCFSSKSVFLDENSPNTVAVLPEKSLVSFADFVQVISLKSGYEKTYVSDEFDNIVFLSIADEKKEEAYGGLFRTLLVQATHKSSGRTYYIVGQQFSDREAVHLGRSIGKLLQVKHKNFWWEKPSGFRGFLEARGILDETAKLVPETGITLDRDSFDSLLDALPEVPKYMLSQQMYGLVELGLRESSELDIFIFDMSNDAHMAAASGIVEDLEQFGRVQINFPANIREALNDWYLANCSRMGVISQSTGENSPGAGILFSDFKKSGRACATTTGSETFSYSVRAVDPGNCSETAETQKCQIKMRLSCNHKSTLGGEAVGSTICSFYNSLSVPAIVHLKRRSDGYLEVMDVQAVK
ncbi:MULTISPECIES: hypothetical protein [unclassified Roseovarius]|uniref:hypothetical protein n=1 Tax=unclassified Roseovarius TaxID=2614913 RepID=UPI00273EAFDF|nr:hypothetical protein [Roseovarius sp. MMSF_3350]